MHWYKEIGILKATNQCKHAHYLHKAECTDLDGLGVVRLAEAAVDGGDRHLQHIAEGGEHLVGLSLGATQHHDHLVLLVLLAVRVEVVLLLQSHSV